jgi:hypothetical protein
MKRWNEILVNNAKYINQIISTVFSNLEYTIIKKSLIINKQK